MKPMDEHDPFDTPREPVSDWERKPRTARSLDWLLAGSMLFVVVGVAWIALRVAAPLNVDAAPAITTAPSVEAGEDVASSRAGTGSSLPSQGLTKCVRGQTTVGYTDGACPSGSQAAASAVLPDLTVVDGMRPEARMAAREANRLAAQQALAQEVRSAQASRSDSWACGNLNAQVAAYDAEARQPLTASRQDELRRMRVVARERQLALRCS